MYWKIDDKENIDTQIEQAATLLRQQEVVAFPTETVYGLGADATNSAAVEKIFLAKGRPSDNPLIVHVSSPHEVSKYVQSIPEPAKKLIAAFMPGPLTVILESNGVIAENVTAGLETVGVRIPDHPVARLLLEKAAIPLAAPSANRSGKPSPTNAVHVHHDLNGKIAGILDGGQTGVGLESTVVDCTGDIPMILRPGGVTREQLEAVVGKVMVDPALVQSKDKPKSPGMKYNHYEPDVPLWLIKGNANFFQKKINQLTEQGKKVGVMASGELAEQLKAPITHPCGSRQNLSEVAIQLYDTLRSFKQTEVDVILCEFFEEIGVGQAIMNRLQKAASRTIVDK
ncbi:L-threonylcarbamoyladenylate synthase [Aquibacillus kalidii]|uniref:L-threonylcarbamoyladenylate synthase n=1 Tax=Aquibacillus kalidii TaxID=2762597 RepID=UPI001F27AC01|nr:L-threonylcarbamoyladenylate synthase [Aquibacillus kalidii]